MGNRLAVAVLATLILSGTPGSAQDPEAYGKKQKYSLEVQALRNSNGTTDVYLTVYGQYDGPIILEGDEKMMPIYFVPPPKQAKKIQLKSLDKSGKVRWAKNYQNVPLDNGRAKFSFEGLDQHMPIQAQVVVQTPDSVDAEVLNAGTVVFLRPDLKISGVMLDKQVRTRQALLVEVVVQEANHDLGATFNGAIYHGESIVDSIGYGYVSAGGTTSLIFTVSFGKPGVYDLTAQLMNCEPGEWDTTNNGAKFSVEVVEDSQIPTQYWLSYNDYTWDHYNTYNYYYGTGEYASKGSSESLYYGSNQAWPVAWPVENVSVKFAADGVEFMNVQLNDIKADWAWSYEEPGYSSSYESAMQYLPEHNAWVYVQSWNATSDSFGNSKGSHVGVSRWAGDYVYSSSGTSKWYGEESSWSYSGEVKEGTFVHARKSLESTVTMTDDGYTYGGTGAVQEWSYWFEPKTEWSYSDEYGTSSGYSQSESWYAWGSGWTK